MENNASNLTKKVIESVTRLDDRKYRRREGLFKAEGTKCVLDTLPHFTLHALYASGEWIAGHPSEGARAIKTSRGELRQMSSLTTPGEVIAVYEIPERPLSDEIAHDNLVLALDTIQDPGNLGTIIRVADWYGITDIICSRETTDCYAPKVIQATMGSISRVAVHYCDLPDTIKRLSNDLPVYGTFLDGKDIDDCRLSQKGIIIIGNEGNGISDTVSETVTTRITLPSYPTGRPTSESLNAAIATAITISKFRSRS